MTVGWTALRPPRRQAVSCLVNLSAAASRVSSPLLPVPLTPAYWAGSSTRRRFSRNRSLAVTSISPSGATTQP